MGLSGDCGGGAGPSNIHLAPTVSQGLSYTLHTSSQFKIEIAISIVQMKKLRLWEGW